MVGRQVAASEALDDASEEVVARLEPCCSCCLLYREYRPVPKRWVTGALPQIEQELSQPGVVTALHAYLGNRLDPYAGTIGRNDHGPSD